MGHVRPSLDVDFAIQPVRGDSKRWTHIEEAIQRTRQLTGISAQYAQDIDRWGAISLMDYQRHTRPYRKFGKIEVRLLDPLYWSIGKITRYLEPDIQDLIAVFKNQNTPIDLVAKIWGKALKSSPPSDACFRFRQHVENFLKIYGTRIWGKRFDFDAAMEKFRKAAGIVRKPTA